MKLNTFNAFLVLVFGFHISSYNLGLKVVHKFTKLSKLGFSMKFFTADILRFFTEKRQNFAFGWPAEYSLSNSLSEIFLEFPNFLRS